MHIKQLYPIRILHAIARDHKEKELGFINRQRQIIVLFYTLTIMIGAISNLIKVSGAFDIFFTVSNSLLLLFFTLISIAYTLNKVDIAHTAALLTISCQLVIAADNIYSALTPTMPDYRMVIIINLLILMGNSVITLATYLIRATQIVSAIGIVSYISCVMITNDRTLIDYCFMVLLIFCFISFLGFRITRVAKKLQEENQTLRRDEEELLHMLRLDKEQVKAYINLAKQQHSIEETGSLLNILGETSQANLVKNVLHFKNAQDTDEAKIAERFPDFTPTEIKICQLILRNKKQSEICAILGKTESNISTQRANIRKKLALQPADNLHKALIQRMK